MTSKSDVIASIQPGSTEYGDRQKLIAGIQATSIGEGASGPNPEAGSTSPSLDAVDDPLAALLSGSINPQGQNNPQTTGLSVGPGTGPEGQAEQQDPRKVRLQQIATTASSPLLRASARAELRRLVLERI